MLFACNAVSGKEDLCLVIFTLLEFFQFLHEMSLLSGVQNVCGFCDDWSISVSNLVAVKDIHSLVRMFEQCSGQQVHRTKSVWITSREMTQAERNELEDAWPNAVTVLTQKFLGVPFGHGVTRQDFF